MEQLKLFPFTFTTSVSSATYHLLFFKVTVGSGPGAKAEVVDVKYFHSPSQRVLHRKVPLIIFQSKNWFWNRCKGWSRAATQQVQFSTHLAPPLHVLLTEHKPFGLRLWRPIHRPWCPNLEHSRLQSLHLMTGACSGYAKHSIPQSLHLMTGDHAVGMPGSSAM